MGGIPSAMGGIPSAKVREARRAAFMNEEEVRPPILSIVGKSGTGKTTLIEKLINCFRENGFRVGTIKHDLHNFEMDIPGKDSWRHKNAGASVAVLSSPRRIGMIMDVEHDHEPEELIPLFSGMDIVFTEGYKHSRRPKIEVYRREIHPNPLGRDGRLIAVVTDGENPYDVPCFSFEQTAELSAFIIKALRLDR